MVTATMLLSVFLLSSALADCSKESALFITAPKNMEALSGSCLLIPCNFSAIPDQDFNSTRTTFGVWIKHDIHFSDQTNNVIFNSSRVYNSYPMNITGDLSQKSCTTLFSRLSTNYTETYYFRIENRPFLATAVCDPQRIIVKDPPNNITENTDQTFTTKIQKTITLSDTHDGLTISCSATYPVNEGRGVKTAEERKTLSVSYAPKNTSVSISPSGLVSAAPVEPSPPPASAGSRTAKMEPSV
ncbi:hypothetical protein FQN60_013880 [Etheostoma spectabile]|uniref:Ig-like domain-containing protein n=1 Tax=Etheostoma spectabile TaxID=54343 RepID=A0A5J5CGC3_9PERO|nr:hypothetical protein FQN60_013880 [Etheostoma spectabile]